MTCKRITSIPFATTDLDALRGLSRSRLERRLAIMQTASRPYPLRFRAALSAVLDERS